jgi:hypothetical protein
MASKRMRAYGEYGDENLEEEFFEDQLDDDRLSANEEGFLMGYTESKNEAFAET